MVGLGSHQNSADRKVVVLMIQSKGKTYVSASIRLVRFILNAVES